MVFELRRKDLPEAKFGQTTKSLHLFLLFPFPLSFFPSSIFINTFQVFQILRKSTIETLLRSSGTRVTPARFWIGLLLCILVRRCVEIPLLLFHFLPGWKSLHKGWTIDATEPTASINCLFCVVHLWPNFQARITFESHP